MTRGTALFALPRNGRSPHAAGMYLFPVIPSSWPQGLPKVASRPPHRGTGRIGHRPSSPDAAVPRCAGPPSRATVWGPSLVRAGLLGKIVEVGERKIVAHWHGGQGRECSQQCPTVREATDYLVKYAHSGLRFKGFATPMPPGWSRPACRTTTCPRS